MADTNLLDQFMPVLNGVNRRDATLPPDFDANAFWAAHIGGGRTSGEPMTEAEIGCAICQAISATNNLAGVGAAGYLALIRIIMVAMREDYTHADEIVVNDLMRQAFSA